MKNRTTRLLRMLSDIRRAQRCTALRAAAAAAEADALLAARDDDPADKPDTTQDDAIPAAQPRTNLRH
ncbi:hypothetical protein WS67_03680 [Burkholderia singularis]|uniref:Uncharacterized protein n=2 Tax=Burkholderia singularis TaxID=1503053 RepID=A0A118DQQ5_9BURK|nr:MULTISPECIES: hypothetical protein [Burkholderia]AOK32473.1 hypothetical protein AQ611_23995 [Burkholderia sp. Bp7605]KVE29979.1 hypothetical protein WS67_03680 [Burkholderia singularis]